MHKLAAVRRHEKQLHGFPSPSPQTMPIGRSFVNGGAQAGPWGLPSLFRLEKAALRRLTLQKRGPLEKIERVVIAFEVDADQVAILGVFYGGQDYETSFQEEKDEED
jgi:hypothetical protein